MGFFINRSRLWLLLIIALGAGSAALLASGKWRSPPETARQGDRARTSEQDDGHHHDEDGHDHDDHAHNGDGHSHDHPGHDDANAIELSRQAERNIGLKVAKVVLQDFQRTVSMPAIVVERPGRTRIQVAAPMTGVVTRIYPVAGEAVEPGAPLFEMRLTHEELVQSQSDFLKTAEELDVVGRELARLQKIAKDGAIAGKTVLEREYEQQKLQGIQRAQRQALLLHGLSDAQVQNILDKRTLLQNLVVAAPQAAPADPDTSATGGEQTQPHLWLQVDEMRVDRGQQVNAGDPLCILSDHRTLYIEGTAFSQDISALNRAVKEGFRVSATRDQNESEVIKELDIAHLASRVDPESRAFHFYVNLPNILLRNRKMADGRRFVNWKFKPGERMQIKVPVEVWKDQIVLPITAVAQDGAETYVFKKFKDHFDRVHVHVKYRDAQWVVVARDRNLNPGDLVSVAGAHQMQNTLKNKASGADPHAGHGHSH